MPDTKRANRSAWLAELAATFADRRCACGAPARLVIVGSDPIREAGILLKRGAPDRNFCLTCAELTWPEAFRAHCAL